MTKEEAIKKINAIKKYLTAGNPIWDVREIDEVLDMAIEALQAGPIVYCRDCIFWDDCESNFDEYGYCCCGAKE